MSCRLDRLWPLAWLKSGAGPDRSGAVPITPTKMPNPAAKITAIVSSKWPKWLDLASKDDAKIDQKSDPCIIFGKMANMRSARAGGIQTLFLLCHFEAISATMRVRRPFKIRAQNTYLKYITFCAHWSCFGRPGYSQSVPWATILPACSALFAPFCHHLRHFLHDLGGWSLKSGSGVQF